MQVKVKYDLGERINTGASYADQGLSRKREFIISSKPYSDGSRHITVTRLSGLEATAACWLESEFHQAVDDYRAMLSDKENPDPTAQEKMRDRIVNVSGSLQRILESHERTRYVLRPLHGNAIERTTYLWKDETYEELGRTSYIWSDGRYEEINSNGTAVNCQPSPSKINKASEPKPELVRT